MSKLIYHYTYRIAFKKILKDGYIKLATAGIPNWMKAAVFFTYNDFWEPTVNKNVRDNKTGAIRQLSFEEMYKRVGVYRIAINEEVAPYNAYEYFELSKMRESDKKHFIEYANKVNSNIEEYRISFKTIEKKDWVNIEYFNPKTESWELYEY